MAPGREGSRLLLALALLVGVGAAFILGGGAADWLLETFGVSGRIPRLVVKLLGIAAALPIGFYVVERAFLSRTTRGRDREKP